ncbi:MAG: agmatinase [Polyangiaceae bacterium]
MQQTAMHYVRTGQSPFFRLPVVDVTRVGAAAYEGAEAVILGAPFDGGTTHHPGARFAPYHVRRVSAGLGPIHPGTQVDVLGERTVIDGGNIIAPPFDPELVRECIQAEIRNVLAAGATPFVCGGDHAVTLPVLRAIAAHHGPVALVHVDAHFDTSGAEVWGNDHHHGTVVRHALEEGLVERGQLFQVGMRATWKDRDEATVSEKFGATVVAMSDLEQTTLSEVGRRIREAVGERPTYVSFDVDAVDPAHAPGTGTPVVGGLSSREALALMRGLGGVRLVGMDVVEVLPALDHADLTVLLAAQLLYEGLALLTADQGKGRMSPQ